MASTASTIAGVSFSARGASSLVDREVRATERRSSRSTSFSNLNSSRNYTNGLSIVFQVPCGSSIPSKPLL